MDISAFLNIDNCEVRFRAKTREIALRKLAAILHKSRNLKKLTIEDIYNRLNSREQLGSTGLGDGVAIPHCKFDEITDFVMALVVSQSGFPFEAIDNRSVHIMCGIVGPSDDAEGHLRLLAAAARALSSGKVRYELLRSPTSHALKETFLLHTTGVSLSARKGEKQKLLFIVTQEDRIYEEVMELLLEIDVPGAVTIESSLMGQMLTRVPLFLDFLDVLGRSKPSPRTILVLVPEDNVDELMESIEEVTGDLDTHRGTCIMVLSTDAVRGTLETI